MKASVLRVQNLLVNLQIVQIIGLLLIKSTFRYHHSQKL